MALQDIVILGFTLDIFGQPLDVISGHLGLVVAARLILGYLWVFPILIMLA